MTVNTTLVAPTRDKGPPLSYCGDLRMGAVVLVALSPPVGITAQLKCVFEAPRHHGCLPCCLAPRSGEGDIYDSSPREPARRA